MVALRGEHRCDDDAENIRRCSSIFCSSAATPRSDRQAAAMSRAAAWPLQDLHAPDGAISPRLHEQIALRSPPRRGTARALFSPPLSFREQRGSDSGQYS
jgi:hypothetical protein